MATIRIKFRPPTVEGRTGSLFYQVIHRRVTRQISTGLRIYSSEWNKLTSDFVMPALDTARRNYLLAVKDQLKKGNCMLESIINSLESSGLSYSADKVIQLFHYQQSMVNRNFIAFAKGLVMELERIGKKRTAETYSTALNSFMRFRDKDGDIPLDMLDTTIMVEYEIWLKNRGVCPNSTSFYMRNLRAVYNRAVDKELTVQRNPFKHVYTGIDKTIKRAVPLKVIRRIRDMDLKHSPSMEYARDIFMFSFYTRGMSFVDIAYLKKTDLKGGVLSYRRRKTGQQLFIRWKTPMQEIIDKYGSVDTPYLFPIIRNLVDDDLRQYRNAAHLINSKLKELGKQIGLGIPLTMYVARHSWASIAKSKNVPLATISEAMGHDSERTTRIYLASLDTSMVDKANDVILRAL